MIKRFQEKLVGLNASFASRR